MKWCLLCIETRRLSRVASLVTAAAVFFGGVELALAKATSKTVDLDSIELDESPAPARRVVKAKTRPKPRKPATATATATASASVDDIQLDDEPAKTTGDAKPTAVIADKVPNATKSLVATAEKLEKEHQPQQVIETLKEKIAELPRSGLLMLARAYDATNETPSQTRALELVIAKNPKDYVALTLLGEAYLKAKRIEDAANTFGTARELNPKYRPAYEGALSLLETTQETYEARTLVIDIIKKFGPDAKSTATLCRLFSGEGFVPEKSENACRRAIGADPQNPDNYVYLTFALRDTEQKEQAFKTISGAASRFPASENVQSLAGELKASDKSFADSYRYYTQAVKANPGSARAQVGFAKSAFELQKHAESIEAFVRACKLDRKTTLDFRQAAQALKKSKDAKWLKYQDAIDERCD